MGGQKKKGLQPFRSKNKELFRFLVGRKNESLTQNSGSGRNNFLCLERNDRIPEKEGDRKELRPGRTIAKVKGGLDGI